MRFKTAIAITLQIAGGRPFCLGIVLLVTFFGWATATAGVAAGPVFSIVGLTLESGRRTEVIGPLF